MGNGSSVVSEVPQQRATSGPNALPSLDELGGYNRPAVRRDQELETKLAWLRQAVLDQASLMESELNKKADRFRPAAPPAPPKEQIVKERQEQQQSKEKGFSLLFGNSNTRKPRAAPAPGRLTQHVPDDLPLMAHPPSRDSRERPTPSQPSDTAASRKSPPNRNSPPSREHPSHRSRSPPLSREHAPRPLHSREHTSPPRTHEHANASRPLLSRERGSPPRTDHAHTHASTQDHMLPSLERRQPPPHDSTYESGPAAATSRGVTWDQPSVAAEQLVKAGRRMGSMRESAAGAGAAAAAAGHETHVVEVSALSMPALSDRRPPRRPRRSSSGSNLGSETGLRRRSSSGLGTGEEPVLRNTPKLWSQGASFKKSQDGKDTPSEPSSESGSLAGVRREVLGNLVPGAQAHRSAAHAEHTQPLAAPTSVLEAPTRQRRQLTQTQSMTTRRATSVDNTPARQVVSAEGRREPEQGRRAGAKSGVKANSDPGESYVPSFSSTGGRQAPVAGRRTRGFSPPHTETDRLHQSASARTARTSRPVQVQARSATARGAKPGGGGGAPRLLPAEPSGPEWRVRVAKTKWRLKWYLKFFMAMMTILKKKRGRYPPRLSSTNQTFYLASTLGENMDRFAEHQLNVSKLTRGGREAMTRLRALYIGRYWLARVRARHNGYDAALLPSLLSNQDLRRSIANQSISILRASGGDPRARARMEVEYIRNLCKMYLDTQVTPENMRMEKHQGELIEMVRSEQATMQMLVNRSNARWVEAEAWSPPAMYDTAMLSTQTDMTMYKKMVDMMYEQGRIALQLIDLGEEVVVDIDDSGEPALSLVAGVDLWEPVQRLMAYKVPQGDRVQGLSTLGRRVLQALVDVEKAAGADAVSRFKVVLCVGADQQSWAVKDLVRHRHYTMKTDNVVVLPIASQHGMMFNKASGTFQVAPGSGVQPSGSGYAMLAMAWPRMAFTVAADGEPEYLEGSVLEWLQGAGVEWIQTGMITDWEALTGKHTQTVNPNFLGPAFYLHDSRGAAAAMEVMVSDSDALPRSHASYVVSPGATCGSCWSASIKVGDVQTPKTRLMLMNLAKEGGHGYCSCTHRFLFHLAELSQQLLAGPKSFRQDIELHGPWAYLSMDLADLTSGKGSKCVAVVGKTRGPELRTRSFTRAWLMDFVAELAAQDATPAFRARAFQSSTHGGPVVVRSKGLPSGKGLKILLFIADNQSSRLAFRLSRQLMRYDGDQLTLVHVASAEHGLEGGREFLDTFQDPVLGDQVIRHVVYKGGSRLTEQMMSEVELLRPDMVMLGSEVLSNQVALKQQQFMTVPSVALAMVKHLTHLPVLVVKSNSAGELFRTEEEIGERVGLRVMLEAQTTSRAVLDWLLTRLDPRRDKLFLARPRGLDADGIESSTCHMLMRMLGDVAGTYRFKSGSRPLQGGAAEALPEAVIQDSCDLLVLQTAALRQPNTSLVDVLRAAKTSILVYRTLEAPQSGM